MGVKRVIKRAGRYKKEINKLTFGLFDNLIDLCLFTLFFSLQGYSRAKGKTGLIESIDNALHITKIVHPNSLKRVIYKTKHKGYAKRYKDYLKITKLGKERLSRIVSAYEEERPWDGIIYIITYDIPEEKKWERDLLRKFLKKIGCGMLQKSVWLTCYNPKRLIADFVIERRTAGLVLVSELKEGSSIGGKDIVETLEKVYSLDKLNKQYEDFARAVESGKLKGLKAIITFQSILKNDPQLPFELLPGGFWGTRAYDVYLKEHKNVNKGLNIKKEV